MSRAGVTAGAWRFLSLGAGAILLSACASVSLDEPFEGTPWRLVQLGGQSVSAMGGDPKAEPRVQFSAGSRDNDSRITGSGGCNRLSGNYQRSDSALRIGPIASTRMACTDPTRMVIESRFPSTEAMDQMVEMGMEEGMAAALGQIDAILATG